MELLLFLCLIDPAFDWLESNHPDVAYRGYGLSRVEARLKVLHEDQLARAWRIAIIRSRVGFSNFWLEQISAKEWKAGKIELADQRLHDKQKELETAITRLEQARVKDQPAQIPWLVTKMPEVLFFYDRPGVPQPGVRHPHERLLSILEKHPKAVEPVVRAMLRGDTHHRTKNVALGLAVKLKLVNLRDDIVWLKNEYNPTSHRLISDLEKTLNPYLNRSVRYGLIADCLTVARQWQDADAWIAEQAEKALAEIRANGDNGL